MTSPSNSAFYSFGEFDRNVLTEIRRETYGEDIGQFSWITAGELRRFLGELALSADPQVLDVGCGSGGPALFVAQTLGCNVTGIDINESGINAAQAAAEARRMQDRVHFQRVEAGERLPIDDATVDAIISIDAMNHFTNREEVLGEWRRVLRPGGRFLFTDATIITGTLSAMNYLLAAAQWVISSSPRRESMIKSLRRQDLSTCALKT